MSDEEPSSESRDYGDRFWSTEDKDEDDESTSAQIRAADPHQLLRRGAADILRQPADTFASRSDIHRRPPEAAAAAAVESTPLPGLASPTIREGKTVSCMSRPQQLGRIVSMSTTHATVQWHGGRTRTSALKGLIVDPLEGQHARRRLLRVTQQPQAVLVTGGTYAGKCGIVDAYNGSGTASIRLIGTNQQQRCKGSVVVLPTHFIHTLAAPEIDANQWIKDQGSALRDAASSVSSTSLVSPSANISLVAAATTTAAADTAAVSATDIQTAATAQVPASTHADPGRCWKVPWQQLSAWLVRYQMERDVDYNVVRLKTLLAMCAGEAAQLPTSKRKPSTLASCRLVCRRAPSSLRVDRKSNRRSPCCGCRQSLYLKVTASDPQHVHIREVGSHIHVGADDIHLRLAPEVAAAVEDIVLSHNHKPSKVVELIATNKAEYYRPYVDAGVMTVEKAETSRRFAVTIDDVRAVYSRRARAADNSNGDYTNVIQLAKSMEGVRHVKRQRWQALAPQAPQPLQVQPAPEQQQPSQQQQVAQEEQQPRPPQQVPSTPSPRRQLQAHLQQSGSGSGLGPPLPQPQPPQPAVHLFQQQQQQLAVVAFLAALQQQQRQQGHQPPPPPLPGPSAPAVELSQQQQQLATIALLAQQQHLAAIALLAARQQQQQRQQVHQPPPPPQPLPCTLVAAGHDFLPRSPAATTTSAAFAAGQAITPNRGCSPTNGSEGDGRKQRQAEGPRLACAAGQQAPGAHSDALTSRQSALSADTDVQAALGALMQYRPRP